MPSGRKPKRVYETRCEGSILIRCCRAFDSEGDVFLRFKLGGVNGLGMQVKRGCYCGMAQQPLNRLHVFTSADQNAAQ